MTTSGVRDSLLMVLLAIAAIASLSDMRDDLAHGSDALHLIGEGAVLTLVGVALAWLLRERGRQHRELAHLRAELDEASQRAAAADGATQAQRRQLGEFIHAQFASWRLTDSVGWLLLKGLSLKEIAALRSTLEKTVRQQASSIYQKAGVSGRHAFAAWFLEDYL